MRSCLRIDNLAGAQRSARQTDQPPSYRRCSAGKRSQTTRHLALCTQGSQIRRTGSSTAVQDTSISAAKFFQALEVLSLASSVGLQAYAVLQMHQRHQQLRHSHEYELYQEEAPSHYPVRTTVPTWASSTATCALTLAFVFAKLGRWIMHGREGKADVQPATSSSASIARLELLADRQAQTLQTFERQLTKVQLKTRVMGHDVRPTLRKVQDENMQQAQVVAVQAQQIEAIGKDLQDTQKLLSALQSVSAKQFDVLLKVMKQQQQQQQNEPKIQPVQEQPTLESLQLHAQEA